MDRQKTLFLIKLPYWLGIIADAVWAVGLLCPPVYRILTGNPGFFPDLQVRLTMGIGGVLMTGWTLLLVWGVRAPVERRFIILLTAVPVVLGMWVISLIGYISGGSNGFWIVGKTTVLFIAMIISYVLAGRMAREDQSADLQETNHD